MCKRFNVMCNEETVKTMMKTIMMMIKHYLFVSLTTVECHNMFVIIVYLPNSPDIYIMYIVSSLRARQCLADDEYILLLPTCCSLIPFK